MSSVIEKNIEMMYGNQEGEMEHLLRKIDAETWKGFSCSLTDFYYELAGEIKFFRNSVYFRDLDFPKEILDSHLRGTFKIAVDMRMGGGIVECRLAKETSSLALHNLEETVEVYNQGNGWGHPAIFIEKSV